MSKRPYGFVHDINQIYFKFNTCDWFYPDPGYSDEMKDRTGYKFDGQIFYRKPKKKEEKKTSIKEMIDFVEKYKAPTIYPGTVISPQETTCLHKLCPTCRGTGQGALGPCIHMLSCPCPGCSPQFFTTTIPRYELTNQVGNEKVLSRV